MAGLGAPCPAAQEPRRSLLRWRIGRRPYRSRAQTRRADVAASAVSSHIASALRRCPVSASQRRAPEETNDQKLGNSISINPSEFFAVSLRPRARAGIGPGAFARASAMSAHRTSDTRSESDGSRPGEWTLPCSPGPPWAGSGAHSCPHATSGAAVLRAQAAWRAAGRRSRPSCLAGARGDPLGPLSAPSVRPVWAALPALAGVRAAALRSPRQRRPPSR